MAERIRRFRHLLKHPACWTVLALSLALLHAANIWVQCERLSAAFKQATIEAERSGKTSTVTVTNTNGLGPLNNWGNRFFVTALVEGNRSYVSLNAGTSERRPVPPSHFAWHFVLCGMAAAAATVLTAAAFRMPTNPRPQTLETLKCGIALLLLFECGVAMVYYRPFP